MLLGVGGAGRGIANLAVRVMTDLAVDELVLVARVKLTQLVVVVGVTVADVGRAANSAFSAAELAGAPYPSRADLGCPLGRLVSDPLRKLGMLGTEVEEGDHRLGQLLAVAAFHAVTLPGGLDTMCGALLGGAFSLLATGANTPIALR